MRDLSGKVVALTGAASGIGRALAGELAGHGAALALADVDDAALAVTAERLGERTRVTTHVVDVADPAAMRRYAGEAASAHGVVDMVVNNAGVGSVAPVEDASYEDIAWVLGVNLWGTIHGVKEFLPLLRQRPEAHIVNVGSVNSFLPFPTAAPYSMSKFGVRALSLTLMQELRGSTIRVSCVYPGGVRTNASRMSRHTTATDQENFERAARMPPEVAARRIVTGIRRDRQEIVVGADAHVLYTATRLLPMVTVKAIAAAAARMNRATRDTEMEGRGR